MPTIDQYATQDAYIRLLLQGPPGAGKTTLACQFPNAWVFDCDLNLGGPLRFLRDNNKSLPIGYDTIDRKDDGTVVPDNMRWQRLCELVGKVGARTKGSPSENVQTLVFDSMSKMADYNKAHVLRTNPTKSGGFEQSSWGFFYSNWIALIGAVTAAKVHCVVTAHEKVDKDELDGSTKYFLNVQGQFKDVAGSMFTDVWRAEVAGGVGIPPKYTWQIRTMPDYRFALKNSFGLPPLFEFDWKLIEGKLNPPAK